MVWLRRERKTLRLTAQRRRFEIPCCLAGISLCHPPDHYCWAVVQSGRAWRIAATRRFAFASACLAKPGHCENLHLVSSADAVNASKSSFVVKLEWCRQNKGQ